MASPLSTPGTPRTSSPLASEDELTQSLPSSPAHGHALATHRGADHAWPSHLTVPNPHAVGASTAAAAAAAAADAAEPLKHATKGKEKAARGPLRLLDLPVDVLKEIILQVRLAPTQRNATHRAVMFLRAEL
jgi:hypothetical protein